ncbi:MAG: hypothetical protein WC004_05025 [Candidatus Absconditabacterales bacterium]
MGITLGDDRELVHVTYNQSFEHSDLGIIGDVKLGLRILAVLGCQIDKSSLTKEVQVTLRIGDKTKTKQISYEQAHKRLMSFRKKMRDEDANQADDFQLLA